MAMKSAQTSFRDRTQEFQSVVERLRKSHSFGSGQNGQSSSSKSDEQRSAVALLFEFNRRASKMVAV